MSFVRIAIGVALLAAALVAAADTDRNADVDVDSDNNSTASAATTTGGRFRLKVGLYPWIPAPSPADPTFRVLSAWIESRFEAAHPAIDLVLQPIQSPDFDFYDLDSLVRWLTTDPNTPGVGSDDGWHVIETDYSFYGSLLARNALATITGGSAQWNVPNFFPVARDFLRVAPGKTVPHWLCSEFVVSRSRAIQTAPNAAALATALRNAVDTNAPAGGRNSLPVVYDLYGSWATPTFYLLGVQQTFGRAAVERAIAAPVRVRDAIAQGSTARIAQACAPRGLAPTEWSLNPCWNGTYYNSDPRVLADALASGQAVAAMGYSETLHDVMQSAVLTDADALRVRTVPNGLVGGDQSDGPLAFANGFVANKHCTSAVCQRAIRAFIHFMNADTTFRYIMTGADTQPPYRRVNRYLSAATQSAYRAVQHDPLYAAIGQSYARERFATWPYAPALVENRLALYAAVRAAIDPAAGPADALLRTRLPDPHARKFFARP